MLISPTSTKGLATFWTKVPLNGALLLVEVDVVLPFSADASEAQEIKAF
jgi:hypothetical protein